uniref:Myotrophin n=1 Tax=Cacopsylla melanoneura TaxID=428564 RepID=A0A8D8WI91_9HEMI
MSVIDPKMLMDLLWAVKNGDLEKVQEIVDNQPDKTYIINKEVEGRKYIHYASDYGQLDVLKYLISNGAHKDDEDQYGIRPIQAAIWEDNIAIVQYLLSLGVSRKGLLKLADSDDMRNLLKPRNKEEEEEDRLDAEEEALKKGA